MPSQKLPFHRQLIEESELEAAAETARQRVDWSERSEAARRWAINYDRNDIQNTKEIALQGAFLQSLFVEVLGYVDQAHGEGRWTLEAHPTTEINATFPGCFRHGSPSAWCRGRSQ